MNSDKTVHKLLKNLTSAENLSHCRTAMAVVKPIHQASYRNLHFNLSSSQQAMNQQLFPSHYVSQSISLLCVTEWFRVTSPISR